MAVDPAALGLSSREPLKDYSLIKTVIVSLLGIASALGVGYFWGAFNLLWGLVTLIVFGIVFIFQTLFIYDKKLLFGVLLLQAVAIAAPFFKSLSAYYVGLILIMLAMFISATLSGKKEIANSFRIPFFRVSKTVLTGVSSAVFLFVFAIYLGFGGSKFLNEGQLESLIYYSIEPALKGLFPGFTAKTTLGDFLNQVVLRSLSEEEKQLLNQAPPPLREQLIRDNVSKLTKSLEGYAGGRLNLKVTPSRATYEAWNTRFSNLENDAKLLVGLIALLILWFLIHSTVAFPLVYLPIAFLGYLLYELLLIAGFIYIHLETQSKEIIVLK